MAWIGGDFIGFRFLSAPLLVSVIAILHALDERAVRLRPGWAVAAAAAALVYGLALRSAPLHIAVRGMAPASAVDDASPLEDVATHATRTSLRHWRPGADLRRAWQEPGPDVEPRVTVGASGMRGFFGGRCATASIRSASPTR